MEQIPEAEVERLMRVRKVMLQAMAKKMAATMRRLDTSTGIISTLRHVLTAPSILGLRSTFLSIRSRTCTCSITRDCAESAAPAQFNRYSHSLLVSGPASVKVDALGNV